MKLGKQRRIKMIENRGEIEIQEVDGMNVPVNIMIVSPKEANEEKWILFASNLFFTL